jgi:hypothetical protein
MAFQRAFLAARQALTAAHASKSRQYAALSAGALARSFHKGCTKACSQPVCCRGLAGPAGPDAATTAAAGAGAGAGKKSKPFYNRAWFRAVIYISGGAIVYSFVDSSVFHPPIENEVSSCSLHMFMMLLCHLIVLKCPKAISYLFKLRFKLLEEKKHSSCVLGFGSDLMMRDCIGRDSNRSWTTCFFKKAACERNESSFSAQAGVQPQ